MNYRCLFREYLLEWKQANIKINDKDYQLIRSHHVSIPRNVNIKIPRDGNMSKTKYENLLNKAINYIDINKQFAIIFKDGDVYSGFIGVCNDNQITIITAIFKEENKDKLFKNILNKIIL